MLGDHNPDAKMKTHKIKILHAPVLSYPDAGQWKRSDERVIREHGPFKKSEYTPPQSLGVCNGERCGDPKCKIEDWSFAEITYYF